MSRNVSAPPPENRPPPVPPRRSRAWLWRLAPLIPLIIVLVVTMWASGHRASESPRALGYSEFLSDVDAHQVKTITLQSSGRASGKLGDGHDYTTVIPAQAGSQFLDRLEKADVSMTASPPSSTTSTGTQVVTWVLIIAPVVLLFWWLRRMGSKSTGGQLGSAMGVGKSKAKVFDTERPDTTFDDVAGYTGAKAEIAEVVDFLKAPQRYQRAGAVAPRGVLMIGPPGTGKTLLARAVAGEADVPFLSVVGSGFVEMFVGVGAARVRDLFAEARKRAPAIVFVDEIDAIGSRRGASTVVANDEREQTLNQLLSEMDGFDPAEGIVVLAATNRPEVLDAALLRPGRFDRQVTIPLPTLAERAAILAVHCRGKHLEADVDMQVVARSTPGFSGADLANLANEAAICAVRDDRYVIRAADFEAARDRILLGRREGSNALLPGEKYAVAVHEGGHALVAALCPHADPIAKVTILPAGQTLGTTEQLPLVERHLYSEDYLLDTLAVRLGGRAAELTVFGRGSTGAANDLAQATELATKMVREFGLSPALGPVGYPQGGSVFLGGGTRELSSRPFAEATQAIVDADVSRLLREAEHRAVSLLESHRDVLDHLVDLLLERETVDGTNIYALLGIPVPSDRSDTVPAATVAPHREVRPTTVDSAARRDGRVVPERHDLWTGPLG